MGPALVALFRLCTIERTCVQSNNSYQESVAERMPALYADKTAKVVTWEQVLVENLGYMAENYGKWHNPERFHYTRDGRRRVIRYNACDFKKDQPKFEKKTGPKDLFR